ncbi:hypothetical protein PanWU01x14_350090 [Parasponia andersonii]|uniref:Uncharacterized protein n=1 Tax=Parasponia andersonii TaxID=3476 RepID=A0A2P5AB23_PARAD|nr:hypothetical protein PanWU01x14_350090 [Parasponia andersonii]
MEDRLSIREFCTFSHNTIEDMVVDSYQGCYTTTEILFHGTRDIFIDSKFIAIIHGLYLFGFNSLVWDMVIKVSLDLMVIDMMIRSSSPSLILMIADMMIVGPVPKSCTTWTIK